MHSISCQTPRSNNTPGFNDTADRDMYTSDIYEHSGETYIPLRTNYSRAEYAVVL